MNYTTVLNAMLSAHYHFRSQYDARRIRQFWRFRAWLIRHDERQRAEIVRLTGYEEEYKKEYGIE